MEQGNATGWKNRALAALVAVAVAGAYANSLRNPFLLDDQNTILRNVAIRHLWPFTPLLHPPASSPVQNRPVTNITLALSYALSGERTWGYHLVNLAVHILNTLLVFGIVRRTLASANMRADLLRHSAALAAAAALLWGVHPLATAAVSYITERTESVMALFYLLTLYCVNRAATGEAWWWQIAAVAVCALGMGSKEVMVGAPVAAILYDRVFLSRSGNECLSRRGWMYAGLAATWGLLALLLMGNISRGGAAGFGSDITPWHYLLTSCQALVMYIKLQFWPSPLVFDYGTDVITDPWAVWPQALLLLALLFASIVALWRRPWLGFLGMLWFIVLGPSSSVFPLITQTRGEFRMYLPLAATVVAVVVTAYLLGKSVLERLAVSRAVGWTVAMTALAVAGGALGAATLRRNADYASVEGMWQDVITTRPQSMWAWVGHGRAAEEAGHFQRAVDDFTRAIAMEPGAPTLADNYNDRGIVYKRMGRYEDAVADFTRATQLKPDYVEPYFDRAIALQAIGRIEPAIADYTRCIALRPDYADAYNNRGNAYTATGRYDQAIADYTRALELDGSMARAYLNRGNAYFATRRFEQAIADYTAAVGIKANFAQAYIQRSMCYANLEDFDRAWADVRAARQAGGVPPPQYISQLTAVSGRSQ